VFGSSADKECHDPRQNWDGSSGSQWASLSGNTIGQINRCTLVDLGKTIPVPPGTAARDGDTAMYTANKPLSTVGELGYLYFGRNWETIRLYKHGTPPQVFSQHNVLEFFTVESGSNPFLKGRVNVSTRHSDVLRAIFYDMPLDYPSGTSANRLAPPLLDTVVDMVLGLTGSTNMTSLAPLESLNWGSLLPSGTELDKEGFIRNSVGLLNTRQHLFVVLLYAQTTKTVPMMPDRSVVAGLRGVAEVWRDPIVSTNGFRTQSIRYFSVLSE
jgi:hypothetical protein